MNVQDCIVMQFQHPRGMLGRMAGWVMAHRPSNRDRNRWTVDLLNIQPHDHILEFGCGPGLGLQACLSRATDGYVIGLDHSQTMLDQTRARNKSAVLEGRLHLQFGSLSELARTPERLDKIFSVNVIQFVDDKLAVFNTLHAHLKPNGIVATTYMPRGRKPSRAKALNLADDVKQHMEHAGFVRIRIEELPLQPVPAVCILGAHP
jgi:cyclopropane fatty-acyl-phospholipid synthase-like methyltransferase